MFVYDIAQNAPKSVFSVKGHDGILFIIMKATSKTFCGFLTQGTSSYPHHTKTRSTFGTDGRHKTHQERFSIPSLSRSGT